MIAARFLKLWPGQDGWVMVDGGVPIRDLNRVMDWSLPDGASSFGWVDGALQSAGTVDLDRILRTKRSVKIETIMPYRIAAAMIART